MVTVVMVTLTQQSAVFQTNLCLCGTEVEMIIRLDKL